jgi:hypothetical protein
MAFITSIKRAFGFADEEDSMDEFDEIGDTQTIPVLQPASEQSTQAKTEQPLTPPGDIPVEIIDAVLEMVNASLSPLVRDCIDHETERQAVYRTLGPAVDAFAKRLESETREKLLNDMTGDRTKLQTELEGLRSERKEIDAKRDEQKAALLSEQRQRRALSERNHDLELKIAELDADNEQNKLTIQSLTNKLRMAELAETDMAALRQEIDSLHAQVEAKSSEVADLKRAFEAKEQEISELQAKLSELESGEAVQAAIAQRDALIAELNAQKGAAATQAPEEQPRKPRRRRGRPRKDGSEPAATSTSAPERPDSSAEATEMAGIDWLLPGGAPASQQPSNSATAATATSDFGYQPPQQLPPPDPQMQQLTLF